MPSARPAGAWRARTCPLISSAPGLKITRPEHHPAGPGRRPTRHHQQSSSRPCTCLLVCAASQHSPALFRPANNSLVTFHIWHAKARCRRVQCPLQRAAIVVTMNGRILTAKQQQQQQQPFFQPGIRARGNQMNATPASRIMLHGVTWQWPIHVCVRIEEVCGLRPPAMRGS